MPAASTRWRIDFAQRRIIRAPATASKAASLILGLRRTNALSKCSEKIRFCEPDPPRQRITAAQAIEQACRQLDDHRAFAAQPARGDTRRKPARCRDQEGGAIEQDVERLPQAGLAAGAASASTPIPAAARSASGR